MRIECTSIDDFLSELEEFGKVDAVSKGRVYLRIDRIPEQPEAITFSLCLWATAIVEGDMILELGVDLGSQSEGGQEAADKIKADIEAVCSDRGLSLRRGKICRI